MHKLTKSHNNLPFLIWIITNTWVEIVQILIQHYPIHPIFNGTAIEIEVP